MAEKVLFVDDEAAVLDGYRRMLHREFEVSIAVGGEKGLTAIQQNGPFAVVISDMRMPGMNGSQFLAQTRQRAPDTVRMLLTGYTDLGAAIEAVNEGNIFRFLTKPCEKELLIKAINSGLEQYKLVTSEKDLLEKTLMGSIKILADVLSAASPEAFGRSVRIMNYVRHIARKFKLPAVWRFEAAATLSQLGCVTLNPDLLQRAYQGEQLSPEDQSRFNAHPVVAMDLLERIPRLESVAWMISQQLNAEIPNVVPDMTESASEDIVLGARILKFAVALDDLRMKGVSHEMAIGRLRSRQKEFEQGLVDAFVDYRQQGAKSVLRTLSASKLSTGMILEQEIRNRIGMLVVAKGQEVTRALIVKLNNFAEAGLIDGEFVVMVPL